MAEHRAYRNKLLPVATMRFTSSRLMIFLAATGIAFAIAGTLLLNVPLPAVKRARVPSPSAIPASESKTNSPPLHSAPAESHGFKDEAGASAQSQRERTMVSLDLKEYRQWYKVLGDLFASEAPDSFELAIQFLERPENWRKAQDPLEAIVAKMAAVQMLWKCKDSRTSSYLRSLLTREHAQKLARGWQKFPLPSLFEQQPERIVAMLQGRAAHALVLLGGNEDVEAVRRLFEQTQPRAQSIAKQESLDFDRLDAEDRYQMTLYSFLCEAVALKDLVDDLGGADRLGEVSADLQTYHDALIPYIDRYSLFAPDSGPRHEK